MVKLETFDGHLVLWAKGHYSAKEEITLFDELKRIWAIRCGLDFEHVDDYSYEYIANRLYKILIACEPQKEKYIHELIHKELTSNIGYPDNLTPIKKLIWIYRSRIANLQIYEINRDTAKIETLIDLPKSQPDIFKRIVNGDGEYKDYELIINLDERKLNEVQKKLDLSDVRNMLIEFGNWLYEDDWREMDDGHTERVVDRFLNSIN